MALPYYMTPLLGALAWSLLGAPESGFLNQSGVRSGGSERPDRHRHPFGIAWVMALFEGSVAFVMIGAVDEVDGPGARGSLAGDRRQPAAHHADA